MRFETNTILKSGLLALTLTAAGGLLATSAATASDEGYGYSEHSGYMADMGERVSKADKEFADENEAGNVDPDLEEAWNAVVAEWNELEQATEENWEAAKADMNQAWDDFQEEWNETFSDEQAN